jgi:predicted transposase/invertase (TIGR01784 family)
MRFINPKTDYAFKRIFGSDKSQGILISFLNSLLYESQPIIQSVQILNPYQAPPIRGVKDTYLDVKATLNNDRTVIIEMQVLNVEGFEKRILYNAAKAYSIQLKRGDDYGQLNPVIALTITDFTMFDIADNLTAPDRTNETERVISRFILKEKTQLTDYPVQDLELVFVELPKFKRSLSELTTLEDKWLYFLKHARQLDTVPPTMGSDPAIAQAFTIANEADLTSEELDDLEHREIFIHDQRNAVLKASRQGREEGREETKQAIARQLLSQGIPLETIALATGLTRETLQSLNDPQP